MREISHFQTALITTLTASFEKHWSGVVSAKKRVTDGTNVEFWFVFHQKVVRGNNIRKITQRKDDPFTVRCNLLLWIWTLNCRLRRIISNIDLLNLNHLRFQISLYGPIYINGKANIHKTMVAYTNTQNFHFKCDAKRWGIGVGFECIIEEYISVSIRTLCADLRAFVITHAKLCSQIPSNVYCSTLSHVCKASVIVIIMTIRLIYSVLYLYFDRTGFVCKNFKYILVSISTLCVTLRVSNRTFVIYIVF